MTEPSHLPRVSIAIDQKSHVAARRVHTDTVPQRAGIEFVLEIPNELISQAILRSGYTVEMQRRGFLQGTDVALVNKVASKQEMVTQAIDQYLKKAFGAESGVRKASGGNLADKKTYATFEAAVAGKITLPVRIMEGPAQLNAGLAQHMTALFKDAGAGVKGAAKEASAKIPGHPLQKLDTFRAELNNAVHTALGLTGTTRRIPLPAPHRY